MKEKSIIEALLFVSNNPISRDELKEVLKDITNEKIEELVNELNEEYLKNERSFHIEEIAGGWQMRTLPQFSKWIKELLDVQHRERLSAPALETLAIIAYKQPIAKAEIEGIRGVNADYILHALLDRGLIRIVGRKDVIGRPFLYGTADQFLEHFGLSNLKDLPGVSEFKMKKGFGGKDESGFKEVAQRDK